MTPAPMRSTASTSIPSGNCAGERPFHGRLTFGPALRGLACFAQFGDEQFLLGLHAHRARQRQRHPRVRIEPLGVPHGQVRPGAGPLQDAHRLRVREESHRPRDPEPDGRRQISNHQ